MPQDYQNGDRLQLEDGAIIVYQNGQWVEEIGQPQPSSGYVAVPSRAEQRAEEDQAFQRESMDRAAATAERLARAEERTVAQQERQSDRAAMDAVDGLRREFEADPEVRQFRTVAQSYRYVEDTARNDSAAGDLSLIFAFMRMLDPNSVVRETEFANAQQAAGALERMGVRLLEQPFTGERLSPRQRADFVRQAHSLYASRLDRYNNIAQRFRGLAKQRGYQPDTVALIEQPLPEPQVDVQRPADQPEGAGGWDAPNTPETAIDFDNLTPEERANVQPGTWIRGTSNGVPYTAQVRRAGMPEGGFRPGEQADDRGIVWRETGLLDRAGAFAAGAAEQIPFGDEAVQGALAAFTGEDFSRIRDQAQALNDADRVVHGDYRRAGGVTGAAAGLALPGGGAGRLAAYGAAYGAGAADGGLQDRAIGAGVGAATGYAGGRVMDAASPWVSRQAGRIGNALADFSAPIVNGARNVFADPVPPTEAAVNALARRALPEQEMIARASQFRQYGAQPTLADVIGDAGQGQVRVAATRTTGGRQAAADFAAGRRGEIQDFTARQGEIVSPINRSPQEIDDVLTQYQREASRPEFDAVRGETFQPSPEMSNLIPHPLVQRAIQEAATRERDPALRAALSAYRGGEPMTIGMADRIARVLKGQADAASRTGDRDLAATFAQLTESIRGEARRAVPAYGQALDNFAERARLGDAAELGQGFMGNRGNTRDFVNNIARLPQGAPLDAARAAARSGIESASDTPRNALAALDTMAVGRGFQQRANALVGPDNTRRLREAGTLGRQLAATAYNVNPRGGSNTFLNMADDQGLQDVMNVGRAVGGVATGRLGMAAQGAMEFLASRGFSEQAADELVGMALDPNRTDEVIRVLGQRMSAQEANGLLSEIRRRAVEIGNRVRPVIAGQGAQGAVGLLPAGQPAG